MPRIWGESGGMGSAGCAAAERPDGMLTGGCQEGMFNAGEGGPSANQFCQNILNLLRHDVRLVEPVAGVKALAAVHQTTLVVGEVG